MRFVDAVGIGVIATCLGTAGPLQAADTPLSVEQQARFLQNARIVKRHDIGKGITHPMRLTLTDGTITHDAAFSSVNERIPIMRFDSGRTEIDFVDSYKYSVAAFRLAELLGLTDMMPVTVERVVDGQPGSVSWWVDDVKLDEGQRLKEKLSAPDPDAWNKQMYRMRLFTQLVADTDRNTGNVLITSDWRLWMIDFTRAFRRSHQLIAPGDVTRCDHELLSRLRTLTRASVSTQTRGVLGGAEIDALMARRDAILSLVDGLVQSQGEARVLY